LQLIYLFLQLKSSKWVSETWLKGSCRNKCILACDIKTDRLIYDRRQTFTKCVWEQRFELSDLASTL